MTTDQILEIRNKINDARAQHPQSIEVLMATQLAELFLLLRRLEDGQSRLEARLKSLESVEGVKRTINRTANSSTTIGRR